MRSMKLMSLALVAMVAVFAVATSAASARKPPVIKLCVAAPGTGHWKERNANGECIVELAKGGGAFEKHELVLEEIEPVVFEAEGPPKLSATGIKIECSALGDEIASMFNGSGPVGEGEETLVYGGCKSENVVGTSENCEARTEGGAVAGGIKTAALESKLGFQETTGNAIATLLKPKAGTEFASIELKVESGKTGKCPATNKFQVTGSLAVENESVGTETVENVLTAPKPALKHFWNAAGTTDSKPELKVTGGFTATYSGKAKVRLSGADAGDGWGVQD